MNVRKSVHDGHDKKEREGGREGGREGERLRERESTQGHKDQRAGM